MSIIRSLWDDPPTRHYPCVTVPVLMLPGGSFLEPGHGGARSPLGGGSHGGHASGDHQVVSGRRALPACKAPSWIRGTRGHAAVGG